LSGRGCDLLIKKKKKKRRPVWPTNLFSDNSIPSFTCFIPIWPLLRKTLTSRVRNKQTYGLWALATLAGKVYDSSLILASFDYFVFKAHIFLLIEQKRERFLDSAAFYHFREYHLHDTSLSSEVSTGISCFELFLIVY
jgi:hypothetical protein